LCDRRMRIERALELSSLTEESTNRAGNLSHGQTQWLELGMVLMQDPKLVLLDEPNT